MNKKTTGDNIRGSSRVSMAVGQAGVNECCHYFTGQVLPHQQHIIRKPHVVLIMWGHYYITNPNVVTSASQLITDLVSRRFMNGLAQYGVGRGSVVGTFVVDIPPTIPPTPDPTNLSDTAIRDQLVNWIRSGTVFPAPALNEQNLAYVIFLPTGSTIANGGAGYHGPGPNTHTKYNTTSTDDDLFWAVIVPKKAADPLPTPANLVNSLGYIVSHELDEAFTNRDTQGFSVDTGPCPTNPQGNNCEIGDICETRSAGCCTMVDYNVDNRTWRVERYWSNWDNNCINGDQPVSVKKFLQAIGVNGSTGLLQLHSNVINIDFVASRMAA
jgi:hypothetical protein